MRKIAVLISLFLVSSLAATSQILQQYTLYNQNHYLINPAAAGNSEHLEAAIGFRQQWAGVSNAPRSFYAIGHTVLNQPKVFEKSAIPTSNTSQNKVSSKPGLRHALGATINSAENGAFQRSEVLLTYSLHLPITREISWSFGLTGGLSNYGFNESKAKVLIDNDPTYNAYVNGENSNKLNMNAGTYLYSDKFFVGYSANQILQNQLDFAEATLGSESARLEMQHYIIGGYHFDLSNDFRVTPNALLKQLGANPLSFDINTTVTYKESISAGLSYRSEDAVSVLLGMKFNHIIKAAYAYDFTTSTIKDQSSGSHELFIGLTLF